MQGTSVNLLAIFNKNGAQTQLSLTIINIVEVLSYLNFTMALQNNFSHFQLRKLCHTAIKQYVQGHKTSSWHSHNLTQILSVC
jgi:hypothetical protein